MNQTYFYRKHLRAPFLYLMLIVGSIFLGIFLMAFGLIITNNLKLDGLVLIVFGIIMLFMFGFIILELVVLYFLFLRRFKSVNVILSDNAIIYNNIKGQTIIPYEDIEKLKFPSIKYTGGWVKIIHRGGNIRLTVVLEHIGDFIAQLKGILDERGMEYTYNNKKLFSFYKTAVFSDESWERVYRNLKIQLPTYYLSIIFTTVILKLFHYMTYNELFIFGSLFAPLLGYVISEIIIGTKVRKRVVREVLSLAPRNTEMEQKIFYISFLGVSVGYLVILLIVMLL